MHQTNRNKTNNMATTIHTEQIIDQHVGVEHYKYC